MKTLVIITLIIICPILMYSQNLEVDGQVKISEMNPDNNATLIVVKQADGTLAIREASTLTDGDLDSMNEIQDLSLVGNILTITLNGSATQIDLSPYLDNTDTQLTEAQVDAYADNNGYLETEVVYLRCKCDC